MLRFITEYRMRNSDRLPHIFLIEIQNCFHHSKFVKQRWRCYEIYLTGGRRGHDKGHLLQHGQTRDLFLVARAHGAAVQLARFAFKEGYLAIIRAHNHEIKFSIKSHVGNMVIFYRNYAQQFIFTEIII